MCNAYQVTSSLDAMRDLVRGWKWRGRASNEPMQTDLWPNYQGTVIRLIEGELVVEDALWGMPTPPSKNRTPGGKQRTFDKGVTNIRDLDSGWWAKWSDSKYRCLVPMTRFTEPDRSGQNHGFAFTDDREVVFMAGICAVETRKVRDKDLEPYRGLMYGFLTTEASGDVSPVHAKAMPVILDDPDDYKIWLTAEFEIARKLQKPLDDGLLVATPMDVIPMNEGLQRHLGLL